MAKVKAMNIPTWKIWEIICNTLINKEIRLAGLF
jgi:hypothetical protein